MTQSHVLYIFIFFPLQFYKAQMPCWTMCRKIKIYVLTSICTRVIQVRVRARRGRGGSGGSDTMVLPTAELKLPGYP